MRRRVFGVVAVLLVMIFLCCCPITVAAQTSSDLAATSSSSTPPTANHFDFFSGSWIGSLLSEDSWLADFFSGGWLTDLFNQATTLARNVITGNISVLDELVENELFRGAAGVSFINGSAIVSAIFPISMVIGLLLMMILWCINMAKKAMQLELSEGKKVLEATLPLLFGLIFMPISYGIFELIQTLSNLITFMLIRTTNASVAAEVVRIANLYLTELAAGNPMNLISALFQRLTNNIFGGNLALIILEVVLLVVVIVSVSIRYIKLAIYQGTAPAFIGLSVNDDSKHYLRNFVTVYIETAIQLPIIALLYGAYQIAMIGYLNPEFSVVPNGQQFFGSIIMIVFIIMIIKSDKIFAKVFH